MPEISAPECSERLHFLGLYWTEFPDRLNGYGDDDTMLGYRLADRIHGFAGSDTGVCGSGNDSFAGRIGCYGQHVEKGNDRINGGEGVVPVGHIGDDTVTGGAGENTVGPAKAKGCYMHRGLRDQPRHGD